MSLDTRDEQTSSLEERVQQLERLLEEQRERSATQEAEIARLRAAPEALMPPQLPALAALPTAAESAAGPEPEATPAPRGGAKSRRALLKLGGAAAAAGVAAVAAGVTELAHPGTARANGLTWQTGVFNADNQTVVEPQNASFPDPTLLTVRVGIGPEFTPLPITPNQAAIAAYDCTTLGAFGVYATSTVSTAVAGESGSGFGVVGHSTSDIGVYGITSGSGKPGVYGRSTNTATYNNAVGVTGTSQNGYGVYGFNTGNGVGAGVVGHSPSGYGVSGSSDSGYGVSATSISQTAIYGASGQVYGAYLYGGRAPIVLAPAVAVVGAPTTDAHLAGELFVDSAGVLWYCTTVGTPGTWMRLSGPLSGVPGGALSYLAAPIRIFDSRVGQPAPLPSVKGALAGGNTYTIQVTGITVGGLSVPAGATGVFGNLTVTNTQGGGDLVLWPHGASQPLTSNINYSGGMTIANAINVGLSSSGAMDLYVHVSGTDVIFDVAGYVL